MTLYPMKGSMRASRPCNDRDSAAQSSVRMEEKGGDQSSPNQVGYKKYNSNHQLYAYTCKNIYTLDREIYSAANIYTRLCGNIYMGTATWNMDL